MTTSRATLAFACGSKSITRTLFSRSTKAPARLITVVVFPTPPLLFATVMMRGRVGAGFVIPFPFCPDRSRARDIIYDMPRQEKLQRKTRVVATQEQKVTPGTMETAHPRASTKRERAHRGSLAP